jgi:hypothetical protein
MEQETNTVNVIDDKQRIAIIKKSVIWQYLFGEADTV